MARLFTSVSVETTLSATISSSATSITVANAAALLGDITIGASDQFTVAIDPDTVSEEIVFVTAANTSTNTLTVTRGRAGTSAITHASGAQVKHVLTSSDLTAFEATTNTAITAASTSTLTNKTIALGSNTVSGTTAQFNTALTDGDFATLAGSETLTNKNLTSGTNTFPSSLATLTGAQTLTNKTIDYNSNTITNLPVGGQTLLSTTSLSSTETTISSIALSYKDLLIYVYGVKLSTSDNIYFKAYSSGSSREVAHSTFYSDINYSIPGTQSASGILGERVYIDSTGMKLTLPGASKNTTSTNNTECEWVILIRNYTSAFGTPHIEYKGAYLNTSDRVTVVNGTGYLKSSASISTIKLYANGATFDAGAVKIYGIN